MKLLSSPLETGDSENRGNHKAYSTKIDFLL
jgi:hypothetical protein